MDGQLGGDRVSAELTKSSEQLRLGATASLPIVIGYLAISIAYGILARKSGLNLGETLALSLFVYAGASQFIAVGMFAAGTDPAAIIVTTLLVNLRHLLYSASLSPWLRGVGSGKLAALAFQVTDEAFALEMTELPQGAKPYAYLLGIQMAPYLAWNFGSLLGGLLGGWIGGISRLGLDFALPAMFIALLVAQLQDRKMVAAAVLAGTLSILISILLKGSWNVIMAALITATLGMGWERWTTSSGS